MSSRSHDDSGFLDSQFKHVQWTPAEPDSELGEPIQYEPHRVLLRQGELPSTVSLIRSGIVKLAFSDATGRENILGLRSNGWWVGYTSIILGIPSVYKVVTLSPCSVATISSKDFCKELEDKPSLIKHLLLAQCRELLSLQQLNIVQGGELTQRLQLGWNNESQANPASARRQSHQS